MWRNHVEMYVRRVNHLIWYRKLSDNEGDQIDGSSEQLPRRVRVTIPDMKNG